MTLLLSLPKFKQVQQVRTGYMLTLVSHLSLKHNPASLSHSCICLKTWILSSPLLTKHGSRAKNSASPLELSAVLPSFTFPALMPQVRSSWSHVSLCISQPPGPNSQGITNFTRGSASKYKKRTIVLLWIGLSNVSSHALEIYIKAALWKGTLDQEPKKKKKKFR